ncbi:MAG TPA: ABC transporter permease [Gemmatimonadaceae bacterium]|nr:ABC transporter permease [Gemmatimonadaceae bacterium]
MPLADAIRLALAQLRVQKLKSFFMLLGVTIGTMFLIAVVSIVEGMSRYMEHDFIGKLMGIDTFELRRRPSLAAGNVTEATWREWQRRPRLRTTDIEPVVASLPPGTHWSVESEDNVVAESRFGRAHQVTGIAVDGDYFRIKRLDLAAGRVFAPEEIAAGARVVVIGDEVRRRYFPGVDPIGRELRVAAIPYRVIGVIARQGTLFGLSQDRFLVAPRTAPLQRLLAPPGVIDAIAVQSATGEDMTDAMEQVRQVMRGRRHLRPMQPDDFTLETSESALTFWRKIKRILVIAGTVLPLISLVVGAMVIMNIMLVAVAERTFEIGIRKALGARRRDIMAQFLVEATTLSTIGAAVGIVLGVALSQLVARVSPLPAARVAPWSIGAAVLLGAGVGIAAGIYPASRASRLDPIAALRQE